MELSDINDLINAKARRLAQFRFDKTNSYDHERMVDAANDLADLCKRANDLVRIEDAVRVPDNSGRHG